MAEAHRGTDMGSMDLFGRLWQQRRTIVVVTLIGGVVGALASFLIPPLYKSEVVLFPAISNSVSKSVLNPYATGRDDILGIGDDDDAEHLIQIIVSDGIRQRLAGKYDLFNVYDIDPNDKHKHALLKDEYEAHVSAKFTKYGSVRITVLDEEPQRAADMANDISGLVDTVWHKMQLDRAAKSLRTVETTIEDLRKEIGSIQDSIQVLNEQGVQQHERQIERFTEQLGRALVANNSKAVKEIEERMKALGRSGATLIGLQHRMDHTESRLNTFMVKYEQIKSDLNRDLPFKFTLDQAYPADRKSSPVRWLIALGSAVAAFVLVMLLIALKGQVQRISKYDG